MSSAAVDATGKIVETTAVYPHEPQRRWDESVALPPHGVHDHGELGKIVRTALASFLQFCSPIGRISSRPSAVGESLACLSVRARHAH